MQLPQITIDPDSKITIRRMLPFPGEILVQSGQSVEALTIVGRAEMPGRYRTINIARQLGQLDLDMDEVMRVEQDDEVKANEVIATIKKGLFSRSVKAPASGYIAAIGAGWVVLETDQAPVELTAFMGGVVSRVLPDRGVIIEANGAMIEATCGFGGEAFGRLKRLANSPYEMLAAEAIDESAGDSIILAGSSLDEEILRKAEDWKVRGIIVGTIPASLLNLDPRPKLPVVATEGFGNLPMSPYTFGLLTSLSRREISIRGYTPNLAGMHDRLQREDPPVIVASNSSKRGYSGSAKSQTPLEVMPGSRVRVIQGKLLGANGAIESIPAEPQPTEAGIITPGANVKLQNEIRFIPWANLELIG